jgi:ubiquinone biosynthesis protein
LIQFIDMSKVLAMGTADDLVAHVRRFHTYLGEVDWVAVKADVEPFVAKFRAMSVRHLEYGELINEMLAIGRRHRVRPVTDVTLVFVALITVQGLGKMLNPNDNVFMELARYLIPILHRRGERVPETDQARAAAATGAAASAAPGAAKTAG